MFLLKFFSTSDSEISEILGSFPFFLKLYNHFLLKINFTNFQLILRMIQIFFNENFFNTLMLSFKRGSPIRPQVRAILILDPQQGPIRQVKVGHLAIAIVHSFR